MEYEFSSKKIRYSRSDPDRRKEIENLLRNLVSKIYEASNNVPYEGNFEKEIGDLAYVLATEWIEV